MKIYFLLGFLVSLYFCRHIAKEEFFIDRFFDIKMFDFFLKKTNIVLRLIGYLDLWNDKRKPTTY